MKHITPENLYFTREEYTYDYDLLNAIYRLNNFFTKSIINTVDIYSCFTDAGLKLMAKNA